MLVFSSNCLYSSFVKKMKMRGHSTAYNAGVLGKELGCKVVALNHFGSASCGREYVSTMVAEAIEGNQSSSQIIASYDFLEVWIPRGGFDFKDNNTISK